MMVNIMQFLSIQRRFVMYRLVCFALFWYIVFVFFFLGWEEERRILFASK